MANAALLYGNQKPELSDIEPRSARYIIGYRHQAAACPSTPSEDRDVGQATSGLAATHCTGFCTAAGVNSTPSWKVDGDASVWIATHELNLETQAGEPQ